MSSDGSNLTQLDGGTKLAGTNHLVGTTTFGGAEADVEMLGNVDYTNGSGRFFGFLKLKIDADNSVMMDMDGQAKKDATTGVTALDCDLEVIGGTGSYQNATGSGHFTGSRNAAVGSPIHIDVSARVDH